MSTLKTNNIEHLDAATPSIQTTIGGGVVFAGLSTFQGNAQFDGNVNIAGTVTYDDVTNIDSVGIITAQSGIHVTSGNVGIGTDDPNTELEIQSATDPKIRLQSQEAGNKRLDLYVDGGEAVGTIAADQSSSQLAFRTSGAERVRINSAGNVGIGTDNPSSGKLQVQDGGIAIRGAATPNINFSPLGGGSGNADISFDGNDLKIISNSSSANIRIGAFSELDHIVVRPNGNVGIGTDDPQQILHTLASNLPEFQTINNNKKVIIEEYGNGNSNAGIEIRKRFNNDSVHPANYWIGDIHFKGWDGDQYLRGAKIEAVAEGTPANDQMPCNLRFSTNSGGATDTERLRITAAGNVDIIDGNLIVASGHGIDFSDTNQGSGAGSVSELLDDYEEGTWTPAWASTSTAPTVTYSSRGGTYVKIGRLVTVTCYINNTSSSGGSGGLTVDGLPFQVDEISGTGGSPAMNNIDLPNDCVNIATESRNAFNMFYAGLVTRDNANWANMQVGALPSGSCNYRVEFNYFTNS
jgi:hypothetical protein